jgi:hypothetical protein
MRRCWAGWRLSFGRGWVEVKFATYKEAAGEGAGDVVNEVDDRSAAGDGLLGMHLG